MYWSSLQYVCWYLAVTLVPIQAFQPLSQSTFRSLHHRSNNSPFFLRQDHDISSTFSSLNCICIDCKWVTQCDAYHFVETQHKQPHLTEKPTFSPVDGSPRIEVHIRDVNKEEVAAEAERMNKEHAQETEKARAKARAEGLDPDKVALVGEEKYKLTPIITTEYDVVACESFEEDKGCWVRNMPEEIRLANPDFVPS